MRIACSFFLFLLISTNALLAQDFCLDEFKKFTSDSRALIPTSSKLQFTYSTEALKDSLKRYNECLSGASYQDIASCTPFFADRRKEGQIIYEGKAFNSPEYVRILFFWKGQMPNLALDSFYVQQYKSKPDYLKESRKIRDEKKKEKERLQLEKYRSELFNDHFKCGDNFSQFIGWSGLKETAQGVYIETSLTQFADSMEHYRDCIKGIKLSELERILGVVEKCTEREHFWYSTTVDLSQDPELFPQTRLNQSLRLEIVTDLNHEYVYDMMFSSNFDIYSAKIHSPHSTKKDLAAISFGWKLADYLPYFDSAECHCIMVDSTEISGLINNYSKNLMGARVTSVLSKFNRDEDYSIYKKGYKYVIPAYDCRKGIHKLDYTKIHKLIIQVNDEELIQSIEYVCPQ